MTRQHSRRVTNQKLRAAKKTCCLLEGNVPRCGRKHANAEKRAKHQNIFSFSVWVARDVLEFFSCIWSEHGKAREKKSRKSLRGLFSAICINENTFWRLLSQVKLQVRLFVHGNRFNRNRNRNPTQKQKKTQRLTDGIILRVLELCLLNISMYTIRVY